MIRPLVRTFAVLALPGLLYACDGQTADPAAPAQESVASDIEII